MNHLAAQKVYPPSDPEASASELSGAASAAEVVVEIGRDEPIGG